VGPEFENGDGRLRPSRQQRLPGAEGPPEGCSTAPRHAACGGPIPRSRGPLLIIFYTWSTVLIDLGRSQNAGVGTSVGACLWVWMQSPRKGPER